jgi:carbamate kinase
MKIVIAIGGNALLKKGQALEADILKHNCQLAAKSIAQLAKTHEVILVHGNGPQVGLLSLQANSFKEVAPYPFDVLGAESQGMIGYLLQQALHNELRGDKTTVSLLTQVVVDKNDPAFENLTKPIGPFYNAQQKQDLVDKFSWQFKSIGNEFRRVVASPKPIKIIELDAIKTLSAAKTIVIAAGGGGIPCLQTDDGLTGVEAVIDKDLTATRLALDFQADTLVILTDVDGVYKNWDKAEQALIPKTTAQELSQQAFESGSMQPKISAACQFVSESKMKTSAHIGHLEKLTSILQGDSGTVISRD